MEVPNDWSAEKSTRNKKSQPVNLKSQPVNQNAEKSTRTQKKCDRVALSGKIPLSGSFQVPKSPLRGKNSTWGQNGSCAIIAQRFLSRKHEKHFKVVQDRRLLMERKVGMIPNFAPQFGEQLLGNDWGKLATYPTPANIVVVKEFYTNARKIGDYPAENYLGYVRGHAIRAVIFMRWRLFCVYLEDFQRNRTGSVVNIRRTDLNPLAKYWMAFLHANIRPCSHVSDITLSKALLLYCAIRNLNVNIGQEIANEISMCANTTNSKAPLGHPSLITHLCKIAGVDTSTPPFKRPRKAIDEAYYRQYCGGEEATQPVPPCHTQRERGQAHSQASAETHEAEPFQMRDMYMSLIEEQTQGGRAEAVEASAMKMEEDDADDDEDDAFEDAEDAEEEEDTNDSSD
ncbi:hypothetical protein LR48_Vigan151s000300 [Vigna angularis]|uniref:Putative plant transposon protein domain-containing protein n=1 Tax=Phaseolus angularis TaxID=3914 RepID=A0A0L9T6C9_PHAAN|nr:hypothetical protein LR48_Vigan151s000300 [Vigna angularis]